MSGVSSPVRPVADPYPARRRVLLFVAHTFPPATGSGAHRALAFCRYLPASGWRPVVLTPGTAWAANRDERLLADVPPDLTVVRTRSLEPRPGPPPRGGPLDARAAAGPRPARRGALTRLKSQLAHAQRFPDAHAGWIPFAVTAGLRAARDHRAEALYSTSGPFSNHVVALALHRLTGLPWVAELRDGWYRWNTAIFPDYPAWRHQLERPLEGAVIRSATRVVLVTERMADAFRAQYADLPRDHFQTIPNGFDPRDYANLPPIQGLPARDRFDVLHAGALYHGRSIGVFLEAAGRLAATDPAFARQFRLVLLGSLDEGARAEVAAALARHGLAGQVAYHGYLSHHAALLAMREADLLLLINNTTPGAEATVPGKLFEYLAVGRPILAIVPPGAETIGIVQRTRAGWVARAPDVDSVLAGLRAAFQAYQSGRPFLPDAAEVARFDRQFLAGNLAATLDTIVEQVPRRPAPAR